MARINWEERDDRHIFNEELIKLMENNLLIVDPQTLQVTKWHGGHKRFKILSPQRHPKSGRYRYNIVLGTDEDKRQRTIYRSLLIWLWTHRQTPPDGKVLDHINGDNSDDRIGNLQLREDGDNSADNSGHTAKEAYNRGAQAKLDGLGLEDNFYPQNSNRFADWEKGFLDTEYNSEVVSHAF